MHIKNFRNRIVKEIAHTLEPELDKQKEINLRLLKEIEELKIMVNNHRNESKAKKN